MEQTEALDIQIWILRSVDIGLFSVLIFILKQGLKSTIAGLKKTNDKLESLTDEVHELNVVFTSQKADIKANSDANDEQDRRLNKHSDRIRDIEISIAKGK